MDDLGHPNGSPAHSGSHGNLASAADYDYLIKFLALGRYIYQNKLNVNQFLTQKSFKYRYQSKRNMILLFRSLSYFKNNPYCFTTYNLNEMLRCTKRWIKMSTFQTGLTFTETLIMYWNLRNVFEFSIFYIALKH